MTKQEHIDLVKENIISEVLTLDENRTINDLWDSLDYLISLSEELQEALDNFQQGSLGVTIKIQYRGSQEVSQ